MGEFFTGVPIEDVTRVPSRPLGDLSDFVVMELPTTAQVIRECKGVPAYLDNLADRFVAGVSPSRLVTVSANPKTADLALLDLLFLDNALARRSRPNPTLTGMVDELSVKNGRPPILTYEDLILVNPLDTDPRTATDGELGSTELDFYKVHREIEGELAAAIAAAKATRETLVKDKIRGLEAAVESVHSALLRWNRVCALELEIEKKMPEINFTSFRDYFQPHPTRIVPGTDTKYAGPSGAFSAAVPVFEMIFAGEMMKPDHLGYLVVNDIYFPRAGRRDLQDARQALDEGLSLSQLSGKLGDPPSLVDGLAMVDDEMIRYRNIHFSLVKKFIYGAVEGKTPGTTGQVHVGDFLAARIYDHIDRKRCFRMYRERSYSRAREDAEEEGEARSLE